MNEEYIIDKLKEILIKNIPTKKTLKGRPYSLTNEQLIDGIFLCP